ncbi:hypothetical protein A9Q81_05325 [Gammaproteobacteria bacterium 42_54_T18]|nr:hypothetical protein A9Q81_05325 [Gammaproteobacteria bacterium 42_54_T18]
MNVKQVLTLFTAVVLSIASEAVFANPEAPGMYDARNMGMGGAGLAYLDSPAAVIHNPANLAATENSQHQFNLSLLAVKLGGSFAGPDHYQESDWLAIPLPFWGYNTRVTDYMTTGASVYLAVGFGGGYSDVSRYGTGKSCTSKLSDVVLTPPGGGLVINGDAQNNDLCLSSGRDEVVNLAVFELAFPFSFQVTNDLQVGLAIRFPFGIFEQQTSEDITGALGDSNNPAGSFGLGYMQVESEMFGYGSKPGFLLGFTYDVTSYLSVAATYRTKLTTTFKGDTKVLLNSNILLDPALGTLGGVTIGNEIAGLVNSVPGIGTLLNVQGNETIGGFANRLTTEIDSGLEWSTSKAIEFGIALQVTPNLLFAADWKHQYLKDSNKDFIVELYEPLFQQTGLDSLGQELNWKDVYSWSFGLEYEMNGGQRVRFGYSIGNSATPPEYANAFTPPPANEQDAFYFGYGVTQGEWEFDVGFSYAKVVYEIDQPFNSDGEPVDPPTCRPGQLVKSGCPGTLSVKSLFLGLSANYRL